MDKKWVRAVWREDEKEMELAIPSVWIEGKSHKMAEYIKCKICTQRMQETC